MIRQKRKELYAEGLTFKSRISFFLNSKSLFLFAILIFLVSMDSQGMVVT